MSICSSTLASASETITAFLRPRFRLVLFFAIVAFFVGGLADWDAARLQDNAAPAPVPVAGGEATIKEFVRFEVG